MLLLKGAIIMASKGSHLSFEERKIIEENICKG